MDQELKVNENDGSTTAQGDQDLASKNLWQELEQGQSFAILQTRSEQTASDLPVLSIVGTQANQQGDHTAGTGQGELRSKQPFDLDGLPGRFPLPPLDEIWPPGVRPVPPEFPVPPEIPPTTEIPQPPLEVIEEMAKAYKFLNDSRELAGFADKLDKGENLGKGEEERMRRILEEAYADGGREQMRALVRSANGNMAGKTNLELEWDQGKVNLIAVKAGQEKQIASINTSFLDAVRSIDFPFPRTPIPGPVFPPFKDIREIADPAERNKH